MSWLIIYIRYCQTLRQLHFCSGTDRISSHTYTPKISLGISWLLIISLGISWLLSLSLTVFESRGEGGLHLRKIFSEVHVHDKYPLTEFVKSRFPSTYGPDVNWHLRPSQQRIPPPPTLSIRLRVPILCSLRISKLVRIALVVVSRSVDC